MNIIMRVIPILNWDIAENSHLKNWSSLVEIFTFFKSTFSLFTNKNWEKYSDKVNNIFPETILPWILLPKILSMTVAVLSVTCVSWSTCGKNP